MGMKEMVTLRPKSLPLEDPTCLILSGGGSRIIATLGALCHISEKCPTAFNKLNRFVGTSAGAMLCLLFCCGFSVTELQFMLDELDMADFITIDMRFLFQSNVLGLDDGRKYIHWMAQRMKEKDIAPDISLQELQNQTGNSLVTITTDINSRSLYFLSPDTEPSFPALLAVRASIGIPILFKPVLFKDKCLVDGGVMCPFAFDLFKTLVSKTEVIFGVCLEEPDILATKENNNSSSVSNHTPSSMYEIFCVCLAIMNPPLPAPTREDIVVREDRHTVLRVRLREFYNVIAASREQQDRLFKDGWDAVKEEK